MHSGLMLKTAHNFIFSLSPFASLMLCSLIYVRHLQVVASVLWWGKLMRTFSSHAPSHHPSLPHSPSLSGIHVTGEGIFFFIYKEWTTLATYDILPLFLHVCTWERKKVAYKKHYVHCAWTREREKKKIQDNDFDFTSEVFFFHQT